MDNNCHWIILLLIVEATIIKMLSGMHNTEESMKDTVAKKYYHVLPKQRVDELFATDSKITWNDLVTIYTQPDWCKHFRALDYMEGCWSLIYQNVKGEKDCLSCEDYRKTIIQEK